MMQTIYWNTLDTNKKDLILRRPCEKNAVLDEKVQEIIASVKSKKDLTLFELTQKYDNAKIEKIRVSEDEFIYAKNKNQKNDLDSVKIAINRIQNYQQQCLPKKIIIDSQDGIVCKKVPTAINRVGLYVPGGTAPLLSTLLMLAIPAKIAGCKTRVLCTPPDSEGKINSLLLEAAELCGIDIVCKIGGAQAIAAMAYGTESVPKVDKIFGPGNAWVTLAKKFVALDPQGAAIDLPAGPSEVLVIADKNANPAFIAADLLSQAEHGADSQVLLITPCEKLARTVTQCIELQFKNLSRKSLIEKSLRNSAIILVKDIKQAIEISNNYAPEHLILQLDNSEIYLEKITNAGAVFVGQWTPESMGDYINGANHVLPTSGYASRFSGLSVADFMKYISVQTVSKQGLQALGPIAMQLADIEGLEAHRNAVNIRLDYLRGLNG